MTKPFVMEGDLWLACQEGGHADPAFVIRTDGGRSDAIGWQIQADSIAYRVIDHFRPKKQNPLGDRKIGQARITIELLED